MGRFFRNTTRITDPKTEATPEFFTIANRFHKANSRTANWMIRLQYSRLQTFVPLRRGKHGVWGRLTSCAFD
jgi:hypothetical protein